MESKVKMLELKLAAGKEKYEKARVKIRDLKAS